MGCTVVRESPETPAAHPSERRLLMTAPSYPAGRSERDPNRRTAALAGWLFVATYVTSIAAQLVLYVPVLDKPEYITGVGANAPTSVALGALLEVLLIIANVGTAVVLFPILKRQSETGALAYVTARLVESTFIAIGLVSLLAILTVREDGAQSANAALGSALIAIHDWTFLLGPGFIVGVGNGLILGYLMYRSGLVPRRMAMLGLIGGPLICISGILVLFDVIDAGSPVQVIATIPEFIWELSLGIYLIVKGFKPCSILSATAPDSAELPAS
jgi:Domain of unknown function (DUF4386)